MTMNKKNWTFSSVLLLALFCIASVVTLFPLYCLLLASFKPSTELLRYGLNLKLDFAVMTWKNYTFIFSGAAKNYFNWYWNSAYITLLFTVISLFLSSMVGYGLAQYDFKGRNLIFTLMLVVMMVPVEIIMLPLYKLSIGLRLIDTVWGVILPFAVSPLAVFFFRQYAVGLPRDFMDAGRIDGCTEYGIFARIFVPLMAPAFGAMAILQAMNSWNNFLWPLIVLRTNETFTLPIGLATMLTPYGNNYDVLIAGSLLAILPLLILYVFFQRFFIAGLTVGGVKG